MVSRHDYRGSNLVFLLDVSGSMQPANKLPLLKSALALLVDQLDGLAQVAIVVYAGSSGLLLPSVSGDAKSEILDALDKLQAVVSTNGGSGLRLAYRVAREHFIPGGVNRVILATDGDFNVGVTNRGELLRTIERDARDGICLTALGFGMGNYRDDTLELPAEIVPADVARDKRPPVDALKYRRPGTVSREASSGKPFTLKLRYKEPEEHESGLLSFPVIDGGASLDQASSDFRFAVAMFGMLLRDSEHRGGSTLDDAARLALAGMQRDPKGLRAELHDLIGRARSLRGERR